MVMRIWHGWTEKINSDIYQELLFNKIFPGIENKKVKGYKGIQLLRRELKNETEFITVMRFEDWKSVKEFAGENYEEAYVPEEARKVLKSFDSHSQHYEVQKEIIY